MTLLLALDARQTRVLSQEGMKRQQRRDRGYWRQCGAQKFVC
jgi:hypothetical protein